MGGCRDSAQGSRDTFTQVTVLKMDVSFNHMCVSVNMLYVHVCVIVPTKAKALILLELELQVILICPAGLLVALLGGSAGAVNDINPWAISPASGANAKPLLFCINLHVLWRYMHSTNEWKYSYITWPRLIITLLENYFNITNPHCKVKCDNNYSNEWKKEDHFPVIAMFSGDYLFGLFSVCSQHCGAYAKASMVKQTAKSNPFVFSSVPSKHRQKWTT